MGYSVEKGSGRVLASDVFGWRQEKDTFVTLTKIGTGVSDELWKDFHGQLKDKSSKAT